MAAEKRREGLKKLMKQYDVDGSGNLNEEQVRALLTDYDSTTPPGTPPTNEELSFILKVADKEGDNCIGTHEIEYAMRSWYVYTKHREEMEDKLLQFDENGSGTLSWEELRKLLVSLNGGRPVENLEVDWVMGEADIFGDGQIHKTELVMAVSAWYAHVENRKSQVCVLL
mmetsp:Transcript_119874/g.374842  ORF Transcript_119874/g.374842 Transcript_119874/m.374842 type:complete len:170 (-) Transcript_119874:135-644(-)